MSATRTQVYFTLEQRRALDARAHREGKTLAAVVREAVDAFVDAPSPSLGEALDATYGTMPDLVVPPREEWDRHPA